ncbi:MAG: tRNA lysidine(34) synthetase TilS [Suipraeoptans sp.]
MLNKIENFIKENKMIEDGDKVIIGLSGGPDSMCLLHILLELSKKLKFEIYCIHINHMIRGEEANLDEAFVENICKQSNVLIKTVSRNVVAYAKEKKLSEEEAGREIRREEFEKFMYELGANKIALGHHMNDNAETLLLNLSRGSALNGMTGIEPVNGIYIRPLLCVLREEIEHYLEINNYRFCVDQTNTSNKYARNRIRNNIIPYLESDINKNSVKHMNDAMKHIREVNKYLSLVCDGYIEKCVVTGQADRGTLILAKEYNELPYIFKSEVIYRTLTNMADKKKDIEEKHVLAVAQLFDMQVGKGVDLPYNIRATREYKGVKFRNSKEARIKDVQKPQMTMNTFVYNKLTKTVPTSTYTKWFDCDIITQTVEIRHRQSGDFITINKEGNRKKLKQFFIDEKISREMRDDIWLACDGSHVMWVIGYRQNPYYQITDKTKNILEIVISGGEGYEQD